VCCSAHEASRKRASQRRWWKASHWHTCKLSVETCLPHPAVVTPTTSPNVLLNLSTKPHPGGCLPIGANCLHTIPKYIAAQLTLSQAPQCTMACVRARVQHGVVGVHSITPWSPAPLVAPNGNRASGTTWIRPTPARSARTATRTHRCGPASPARRSSSSSSSNRGRTGTQT
jgi:hypothetical protein